MRSAESSIGMEAEVYGLLGGGFEELGSATHPTQREQVHIASIDKSMFTRAS